MSDWLKTKKKLRVKGASYIDMELSTGECINGHVTVLMRMNNEQISFGCTFYGIFCQRGSSILDLVTGLDDFYVALELWEKRLCQKQTESGVFEICSSL